MELSQEARENQWTVELDSFFVPFMNALEGLETSLERVRSSVRARAHVEERARQASWAGWGDFVVSADDSRIVQQKYQAAHFWRSEELMAIARRECEVISRKQVDLILNLIRTLHEKVSCWQLGKQSLLQAKPDRRPIMDSIDTFLTVTAVVCSRFDATEWALRIIPNASELAGFLDELHDSYPSSQEWTNLESELYLHSVRCSS